MFHSDAAQLTTLVSATTSLLLTFPLTPGIISSGGELSAGYHLVHGSTPALDTGALVTG